MNRILKKVVWAPLKGANIIAGGNAVDALKSKGSPLMKRLASKFPDVSPETRAHLLKRYGTAQDRKIYGRERLKTKVGRAAALTGGAVILYHRSKKKPVYTEYVYDRGY